MDVGPAPSGVPSSVCGLFCTRGAADRVFLGTCGGAFCGLRCVCARTGVRAPLCVDFFCVCGLIHTHTRARARARATTRSEAPRGDRWFWELSCEFRFLVFMLYEHKKGVDCGWPFPELPGPDFAETSPIERARRTGAIPAFSAPSPSYSGSPLADGPPRAIFSEIPLCGKLYGIQQKLKMQ